MIPPATSNPDKIPQSAWPLEHCSIWSRATIQHSFKTSLPVVITKGEFKTFALLRLAKHRSQNGPRFLPVGISRAYNWRGTSGRTVGPDKSCLDVKGAILDLHWIIWQDRSGS
jgi:hypothetical protein